MEANLNQQREQTHALLDLLSPDKVSAVRNLLEVMVEPLARSLALAPGRNHTRNRRGTRLRPRILAGGEGIPHDDILREFGLKQ